MIHARVAQVIPEGLGFLVEFSDGHGEYKYDTKTFVLVSNDGDLYRRLYFKNRMYVCDTIFHWLNQRSHAYNSQLTKEKIFELRRQIDYARKHPYEALCKFVHQKSAEIRMYAPGNDSKWRKNFENNIEPILIECENVATGKALVHFFS